jgi:hypothetical protein
MRNLTLTIHFCDISQSFVSATKYENTSNTQALLGKINEVWANLPDNTIPNLISSMPRRGRVIVSNKGYSINYPTSTRRHGNFAGVHTLLRILLSSNSAVLINIITGVLPPHFDFVVYYVLCQC